MDAHEAYLRGARLFDEGAFFDAHEAWEERWQVETDAAQRLFFQGLIQIAAGFHKLLVMHGRESASRLLARGLAKLEACPEGIAGVSLATFREGIRACARAVESGTFDATAIPRLHDAPPA